MLVVLEILTILSFIFRRVDVVVYYTSGETRRLRRVLSYRPGRRLATGWVLLQGYGRGVSVVK